MRGKNSVSVAVAVAGHSMLVLLAAASAFAQDDDDRAPVPSIKDQLEGRVEDSSGKVSGQKWKLEDYQSTLPTVKPAQPIPVSNDPSNFLRASLQTSDGWLRGSVNNNTMSSGTNYGSLRSGSADFDSSSFLRGSASTFTSGASTNLLRAQTSQTTLQGRVQDFDKQLHLLRPMTGDDPLNRSVTVLSGQQGLQGTSKDETLDQALSANNFVMPKQRPQAPQWASPNMSIDPSLSRVTMSPNFVWSIDGWWVDDYGYGGMGRRNRRYYQQNSFAMDWSPYFDSSRMRVDPSIYSQVSYPKTKIDWSVPPARMTPPPVTPAYSEQNISWDQWYQNISNAMYRNWNRGEMPGNATLRITVSRGRTIQAEILKCNNSNTNFRQSLMLAVASLNQSPILDFPAGSQKQTVNFDSAFSAGINTSAGARSDRHGDIEQVLVRQR